MTTGHTRDSANIRRPTIPLPGSHSTLRSDATDSLAA
jgi:hypothetical protein